MYGIASHRIVMQTLSTHSLAPYWSKLITFRMRANFMDFVVTISNRIESLSLRLEFLLSLLGSYNFNRYFISILVATLPFIYIAAKWWIKIAFICLHGILALSLSPVCLARIHLFGFFFCSFVPNTMIRFYGIVIFRFATYSKMDRYIFRNSMRPHFVKMYIGPCTNASHQMQAELSFREI